MLLRKKQRSSRRTNLIRGGAWLSVAMGLVLSLSVAANDKSPARWGGTWATAMSADADTPHFNNQTLRQIVRVSQGGRALRVRLSNVHGTAPLTVQKVNVAIQADGASIQPGTNRAVRFGGERSVTIAPGARVLSDPVRLLVPHLADLAISTYLRDGATDPTSPISAHGLAFQTSYVLGGNQTSASDPMYDGVVTSYYYLSGVDVLTTPRTPVIVAAGDSITDGNESTLDTNNRWPNLLAARLNRGPGNHYGSRRAGVLNVGISGNQINTTLFGENLQARFDRDVLTQTGVTHVVVLIGINDLGIPGFIPIPPVSAEEVIAGYQRLIARAHARGIKIIGATITPSGAFFLPDYNTAALNDKREAINKWIRTRGNFDGVIDFDRVLRDPENTMFMLDELSADGLHPNDAGYQAMARSVRLSLFR